MRPSSRRPCRAAAHRAPSVDTGPSGGDLLGRAVCHRTSVLDRRQRGRVATERPRGPAPCHRARSASRLRRPTEQIANPPISEARPSLGAEAPQSPHRAASHIKIRPRSSRKTPNMLRGVRAIADVARGPGFAISTVRCHNDHTRWSSPEVRDGYNLVLARRGRFRRRVGGVETDIDATMAYLGRPDTEEQFAHPAGGEVCTWINVQPQVWQAWTGEAAPPAVSTVYVDAHLDLAHRRVLAAARTGDVDYAVAQLLLDLVGGVLQQVDAGPAAMQRDA